MLGVVAGVLVVVGLLNAGVVGVMGVDAPLVAGPLPVSARSLGDVNWHVSLGLFVLQACYLLS